MCSRALCQATRKEAAPLGKQPSPTALPAGTGAFVTDLCRNERGSYGPSISDTPHLKLQQFVHTTRLTDSSTDKGTCRSLSASPFTTCKLCHLLKRS